MKQRQVQKIEVQIETQIFENQYEGVNESHN